MKFIKYRYFNGTVFRKSVNTIVRAIRLTTIRRKFITSLLPNTYTIFLFNSYSKTGQVPEKLNPWRQMEPVFTGFPSPDHPFFIHKRTPDGRDEGAPSNKQHSLKSMHTIKAKFYHTAQKTRRINMYPEHFNDKNSSGDEIANVNFFYDDIVHVEASARPTSIQPTS